MSRHADRDPVRRRVSAMVARARVTTLIGAVARASTLVGLALTLTPVDLPTMVLAASAERPKPPARGSVMAQTQVETAEGAAPEVVVHVTDLPKSALFEFEFWNDPASPGGRMVGIPNTGDDVDPPPEDDPNVVFKVRVRRGIPYRCWIHMKVGRPMGKSQANLLYVQFTAAVDKANRDVLKPGTASYLAARGPAREGWAWIGCDPVHPGSAEPLIYFRTSGDVTVRVQAGMEGVGFDQVLLSPARFLEKPPSEAVVAKPKR